MATQSGTAYPSMTHPRSVEQALADLEPEGAAAIAGGTWLMRAPLRHEDGAERLVALHRIEGFSRLHNDEDAISIGPLTTHDILTHNLPRTPGLRVLREAAGRSANPGVRRLATIGGNIATSAFAASDFAPALLSLDARIAIADRTGTRDIAIEDFLASRATFVQPWLVSKIIVPSTRRLSAHERLPMRRAGDYPCAIVSVSLELDDNGLIREARIGVGALEAVARRWRGLEQALTGRPATPEQAERVARELAGDFTGRDAVDAPGWYRVSVLPVLVRRAFATIQADLMRSPQ